MYLKRSLFAGKISPRLQYAMWLLVAVRLLMPLPLSNSPVSVLNIVASEKHAEGTGNLVLLAQPGLVVETDPNVVGAPTDAANGTGTTDHAVQNKTAALDRSASSGSLSDALHTVWLTGVVATSLKDMPDIGNSIHLGPYPGDFPFGYDLVENSRQTYRAESFGNVTEVECDGLQITYLNPGDEYVYKTVTILRSNKEHYAAGDVAIGDPEESLLALWPDKLRKVDRIGYDDEAWFGTYYDYAYSYTRDEGTKSLVFIIRDGLVSGIEVVDGLDGPMY